MALSLVNTVTVTRGSPALLFSATQASQEGYIVIPALAVGRVYLVGYLMRSYLEAASSNLEIFTGSEKFFAKTLYWATSYVGERLTIYVPEGSPITQPLTLEVWKY